MTAPPAYPLVVAPSAPTLGLVALLLLVGCEERRAEVLLWPALPGAASAILTLSDARSRSAEVYRVVDGALEGTRRQLEVDDLATLHLYTYARRLESLGLEPGTLPSQTGGVALSDPRTDLLEHWRVQIDSESNALEWTRSEEDDPSELRLPESSVGCLGFDVEVLESGLEGMPLVIEVNEDGAYRAVYQDGEYRDFAGQRVRLVEYSLLAGARLGDRLWFMDSRGNLHDFDPDATAAPPTLNLRDYGDGSPGYWLAGASSPTQTEIYTLTRSGRLERYDGSVRTLVHQLPPSMVAFPDRAGGIAWLGPRRLRVAWNSSAEVLSIEDDVITTEPVGASVGLVSLTKLPSGRLAVGDASGAVHLLSAGEPWLSPPDPPVPLWPLSFGELGEDVVYGTALGHFVQFRAGFGFCDPLEPWAGASFRTLTVAEGAIYLGGTATGGNVLLRLVPRH